MLEPVIRNGWIRIEGKNFCIRGDIVEGKLLNPAPLFHWMQGWTIERVQEYCRRKNWDLKQYEEK
jgi:hypothetical protein